MRKAIIEAVPERLRYQAGNVVNPLLTVLSENTDIKLINMGFSTSFGTIDNYYPVEYADLVKMLEEDQSQESRE